MLVWETDPSLRDDELGAAFADVWCAIPKLVFSRHNSHPGTSAISDAACSSRSASCAPRPAGARNVAVRVIGVIEVIGRTLSGAAGRVLEKSARAYNLPH